MNNEGEWSMEKALASVVAEVTRRAVLLESAEDAKEFVSEAYEKGDNGKYCLLVLGGGRPKRLFRVVDGRLWGIADWYSDETVNAAIRKGNFVGVVEERTGSPAVQRKFEL